MVAAVIRHFEPSLKMAAAFHEMAREADAVAVDYEKSIRPGQSRPRIKNSGSMIDIRRINNLDCLAVRNAVRHRDRDFNWSALWVLRSCGHTLHCKRKDAEDSTALFAGAIVLLNVRDWTHWTTGGRGALVVASVEYATGDVDQAGIAADFDEKLAARE